MSNIVTFSGTVNWAKLEGIWQWDIGQVLTVNGLTIPDGATIEMQWAYNALYSLSPVQSVDVRTLTADGTSYVCDIPDLALSETSAVKGYIYQTLDGGSETIAVVTINPKQRTQPDDYISTDQVTLFTGLSVQLQSMIDAFPADITLGTVTAGEAWSFTLTDGVLDVVYVDGYATPEYVVNIVYQLGYINLMGQHDASTGNYPTTGNGPDGQILKGETWEISVGGTLGGVEVVAGALLYCNTSNPGNPNEWTILNNQATGGGSEFWIDPVATVSALPVATTLPDGVFCLVLDTGLYTTAGGVWTFSRDPITESVDTVADLVPVTVADNGLVCAVQNGTQNPHFEESILTPAKTYASLFITETPTEPNWAELGIAEQTIGATLTRGETAWVFGYSPAEVDLNPKMFSLENGTISKAYHYFWSTNAYIENLGAEAGWNEVTELGAAYTPILYADIPFVPAVVGETYTLTFYDDSIADEICEYLNSVYSLTSYNALPDLYIVKNGAWTNIGAQAGDMSIYQVKADLSNDIVTDAASITKYPSVKEVVDALGGKQDAGSYLVANDITGKQDIVTNTAYSTVLTLGNANYHTTVGAVEFALPTAESGLFGEFILLVKVDGAHAITWDSAVYWRGAAAYSFGSSGTHLVYGFYDVINSKWCLSASLFGAV